MDSSEAYRMRELIIKAKGGMKVAYCSKTIIMLKIAFDKALEVLEQNQIKFKASIKSERIDIIGAGFIKFVNLEDIPSRPEKIAGFTFDECHGELTEEQQLALEGLCR